MRHLLLPGHFECCYRPIVEFLGRALPNVKFSLRTGYRPLWRAREYMELGQPLEAPIVMEAEELARSKGLNVIE